MNASNRNRRNPTRGRRAGKALTLAVALAGLTILPVAAADAGDLKAFERSASPQPAPELRWRGPDGAETSLGVFAGKVVLMNLWATWCAPCITELPSLQRLQAKLRAEPFALVAVSIDRSEAGADKARGLLRRLKLDELAFHHDPEGRVYRALGVEVMPTTVVFDRAGREVGRIKGPADWDTAEAEALLRGFIER